MLHTDSLTAAEPERLITARQISSQEEQLERALRPKTLADYIGQAKTKEQLGIFIQAAKKRGEALDHTLLFGPPGLGKTTLAHIIAKELGVNLRQTSGPVLERAGDLAALLTAPPLWHSGCELPIPRLLGSQGFRFLLGLDDAPAPLTQWLEQEAPFGHRLGHYAESLLAFWLAHAPHCQLIARNHPVRSESGQTLGAADFLCLLDSAPYHLELTCKYYGGTTTDDFQGLNPADTLLGKAAKLQQQCRLFHTPQTRAQLPSPLQGYLKTSAASFCEVKM